MGITITELPLRQWRFIAELCIGYTGQKPLPDFLKEYFRAHKNMGSRDRKIISGAVYAFIRTQHAALGPVAEAIACGLYLQADATFLDAEALLDAPARIGLSTAEAYAALQAKGHLKPLAESFPLHDALSPQLSQNARWPLAMWEPRGTFVNSAPDKVDAVAKLLVQHNIAFAVMPGVPGCIKLHQSLDFAALPPALQRAIHVQDIASQAAGNTLQPKPHQNWLDACAGAGGKTLQLARRMPGINLYATDVRPHALRVLKTRFAEAALTPPETAVVDWASAAPKLPPTWPRHFDGIFIDAPCSGSGTFFRHPELALGITEVALAPIMALQHAICTGVMRFATNETVIHYITCAAYAAENEDMKMLKNTDSQHHTYVDFASEGGDTLFATRVPAPH